jgi:hypothetical protein
MTSCACLTSQRNKTEQLQSTDLLQPLPVPPMVWVDIAFDFIEGLTKVNGWSIILMVVDRFSKSTTSCHWGTRTRLQPLRASSSTTS